MEKPVENGLTDFYKVGHVFTRVGVLLSAGEYVINFETAVVGGGGG